jgi:hypothetical protein
MNCTANIPELVGYVMEFDSYPDLEAHVAGCDVCGEELRRLRRLDRVLRINLRSIDPSLQFDTHFTRQLAKLP